MAQTQSELDRTVAANVRAELARANRSAAKMSRDLDWSYSTTQRRLSGEIGFTISELAQLADYLQLPMSTFLPATSRGAA